MARTITQGQSYPLLDRVADSATREVLRMLMDQVNQLRQPASTTNFGGNKLAAVGEPEAPSDAATMNYVDSKFASVRNNLLAAGNSPLDVTALRGQLSQVQRAKLRVNPAGNELPSVGQPFELLYDVDTGDLHYYNADTNIWTAL